MSAATPVPRIVWQLSNSDQPSPLLKGERLASGNTVIRSYGLDKPGEVQMAEVTPAKKGGLEASKRITIIRGASFRFSTSKRSRLAT